MRERGEAAAGVAHRSSERDEPTGCADVLVVDDDASLRRLLSAILADEGMTVVTASNGREALDVIADCPPRTIIVDLEMPVMDGRTLISEIREREVNAAILIVSAYGARRAERELNSHALGVSAAIEKPFDPQDLVDQVRRAARP